MIPTSDFQRAVRAGLRAAAAVTDAAADRAKEMSEKPAAAGHLTLFLYREEAFRGASTLIRSISPATVPDTGGQDE